MKDCGIVKDLLPLVAENMASEESTAFVKEHLETCGDCRVAYETLKTPVEAPETAAPLKSVRKSVKRRGWLITGFVACLIAALLIGVFARLTKPIPITAVEDAFESISVEGDHLKLTICEGVTVRSTVSGNNEFIDMFAYQTPILDMWFDGDSTVRITERSIDTDLSDGSIKAVFFQSFDGTDQQALYVRDGYTPEAGFALPRLVMNYYFAIAMMIAVVLFVPWLVLLLCKKQKARRIVGIFLLIPASFAAAFLAAGFPATTIAPARELLLVSVIAMLLIGAGLCGRKLFAKE